MLPFSQYARRGLSAVGKRRRILPQEVFSGDAASPPALTLSVATFDWNQTDGAVNLDEGLTVSSTPGTLVSATVTISSGKQTNDVLSFAGSGGIGAGSYDSGSGVLTISGSAADATWQTALRLVKFQNTTDPGAATTGTRTISFVVNDGSSNSEAATMDVVVEDAPIPANVTITSATPTFLGSVGQVSSAEFTLRFFGINFQLSSVPAGVNQVEVSQKNYNQTNGFHGGVEAWFDYNPLTASANIAMPLEAGGFRNLNSECPINDWSGYNETLLFQGRIRFLSYGQPGNWTETGVIESVGQSIGVTGNLTVDWETGVMDGASVVGPGDFWLHGPDPLNMTLSEDANLTPNLGDAYFSRAYDDGVNGIGPWAGLESGDSQPLVPDPNIAITVPIAASELTLTPDWESGINATWSAGSKIANESLQFKETSSEEWLTANASAESGVIVSNFTPTGNGTIDFRVQSVNFWGNSNSSVESITVDVPSSAADLTLTPDWAEGITVEWTAAVDRLGSEDIQIMGAAEEWQTANASASSPVMISDFSSVGTGSINFRVNSQNFIGNTTTANETLTINVPEAIANIEVSELGGSFLIACDAAARAAFYRFESSPRNADTWTIFSNETLPACTLSGLASGVYDLRVTAFNFVGDGAAETSEDHANVLPDNQGALNAVGGTGEIAVDWAAVVNAVTFRIEHSLTTLDSWTVAEENSTDPDNYTITGLAAETYDVRVTPKNSMGDGVSARSDGIVVS